MTPDFWRTPDGAYTPGELAELGREPAPVAIVEWSVPIDDDRTARHDVGAYRRDEEQERENEP